MVNCLLNLPAYNFKISVRRCITIKINIDKELFTRQVIDGWSRQQQMEFWGCSYATVNDRHKRWNIKELLYEHSLFYKINTEESAYWLGFLYADGSIDAKSNAVILRLQEQDYDHLVKFKNFIKIDNKINHYKYIDYSCYSYAFKNLYIKTNLIKLGCLPQKTFKIVFPTQEQVPDLFMADFIRGYFDGDGCIYLKQYNTSINLIGTVDFLNGLINYYHLPKHKLQSVGKTEFVKKYYISAEKDMLYFLNLLYKNASVFLERKYNKYLQLSRYGI